MSCQGMREAEVGIALERGRRLNPGGTITRELAPTVSDAEAVDEVARKVIKSAVARQDDCRTAAAVQGPPAICKPADLSRPALSR